MKYAIQRWLTRSVENRRYFVRVRKCKVFLRKMMYRLHLEYCAYGDGLTLNRRYRRKSQEECIPEPFLWHLFETLTEAALVMAQGSVQDPQDDWLKVIHRDMKPDNILFTDQSPDDRHPAYPRPVLADFDEAIQTLADDPLNPTAYCEEAGAVAYTPPEARQYFDTQTSELLEGDKILMPASVWGIGATMFFFVDTVLANEFGYDPLHPHERVPELQTQAARHEYSSELKELVKQRVRFKPTDRITLRELRKQILECVAENGGPRLALGMAELEKRVEPGHPYHVKFNQDKYRVGLSQEKLPPLPVWT